MDENDKKILDKLHQGKIDFEDAMKRLRKTEEEVWEMLDDYEYVPTKEEVLRAFEILRETRDNIRKKSPLNIEKSRDDASGMRKLRFEIYKDKKGRYRFRLIGPCGEIIVASQSYPSRDECSNEIERVKRNVLKAMVMPAE